MAHFILRWHRAFDWPQRIFILVCLVGGVSLVLAGTL